MKLKSHSEGSKEFETHLSSTCEICAKLMRKYAINNPLNWMNYPRIAADTCKFTMITRK